eukprot:1158760-Pelagomonas_calceolata.AAC.12
MDAISASDVGYPVLLPSAVFQSSTFATMPEAADDGGLEGSVIQGRQHATSLRVSIPLPLVVCGGEIPVLTTSALNWFLGLASKSHASETKSGHHASLLLCRLLPCRCRPGKQTPPLPGSAMMDGGGTSNTSNEG